MNEIKKIVIRGVVTYVALKALYLIGDQNKKLTQQKGVIERQNVVVANLMIRDDYLVAKLNEHNIPRTAFDKIVLDSLEDYQV